MPLQRNLNKLVRKVAETLSERYPKFRHSKIVPETGKFEASVPAPRNSRAGHPMVSIHKGNIWIRLAIPHAFYLVDDTSEMVRIIDAFLSDDVFFAIVTFRRKWVETTLVRRNAAVDVEAAKPPLRWPDVPSISVGVRRTRLFGKGRYARAGNRASIVNNGPGTYPPASVFDNRSPSLKQQGRLYPARPNQGRAKVKHGKNVVRNIMGVQVRGSRESHVRDERHDDHHLPQAALPDPAHRWR